MTTTYLVSFATREFALGLRDLMRTAAEHGVDELRPWDAEALRATPFYAEHRAILDQPRGAGYWLWKPYIIKCALDEAADGDIVVYADAGIAILRPLAPLFDLCAASGGILLFAGHYDGIGGQPNVCATWTKRDCFASMGCDTPEFHRAPMVDAAFMLFSKSHGVQRFVEQWLTRCCEGRMVTDEPGSCGLPELPGFIEHRHDQSVLSLLAKQHGLELFRAPSQFGNHCKVAALREPGEWTRQPYQTDGGFASSRYPTLLFHHRKKSLTVDPATYVDIITAFGRSLGGSVRLLQLGVADETELQQIRQAWRGAHLMPLMHVCADRGGDDAWKVLQGKSFQIIVSDASTIRAVLMELERIARYGLLDRQRFMLCWHQMEGMEGWVAFRAVRAALPRVWASGDVVAELGLVKAARHADASRTLGIVIGGTRESLETEPMAFSTARGSGRSAACFR